MKHHKAEVYMKYIAYLGLVCTGLFLLKSSVHAEEITLTATESNLVTEAVANIVENLVVSNATAFANSILPQDEFEPYIPSEIAGNTSIVASIYSEYVTFCTNAFNALAVSLSLPPDTSVLSWSSVSTQAITVSNATGKVILHTTVVVSNTVGQASFTVEDMSIVGTNLWIRQIE